MKRLLYYNIGIFITIGHVINLKLIMFCLFI